MAQLVMHLPFVQVMISQSQDLASHQAPCSVGNLLLPLPLPLSTAHALSRSLILSQVIKSLKKILINFSCKKDVVSCLFIDKETEV